MKRSINKLWIVVPLVLTLCMGNVVNAAPPPAEEDAPELWSTLYDSYGCEDKAILCLRADGKPLPRENLPNNIAQGTAITVKTIGCTAAYKNVKFEVALESVSSGDQLFRTEAEAARPKSARTECSTEPANYTVLHSATMTVPGKSSKISIEFKRHAAEGVPEREVSYPAKVIRGLYFLDVGFAAPFVIGGDRKITAVRDPGVDLRRLELEQDLLIKPAVMLNVFPAGRRLGALTSFAADRNCKGMSFIDKRDCKTHNVGRGFANSLGLQLGLSLDTESFGQQFYMGGMFEPVVGLNLGFGLALIRGEYYRDGFTDGQLIGADVAADEWRREKMMARPYFSISFSLDIIRNVRTAMSHQEITSLGGNGNGG